MSNQPSPITESATNPNVGSFPTYDRGALHAAMLHMSVGGFHRAHQARYLDAYLEATGEPWMIHGVGCLDSDLDLVTAMRAQDNLYSLIERSGTDDVLRVIGALKTFTHAPTETQTVINAIADNAIRIVSLTITEKGYCTDPDGNLDTGHPQIAAELAGGAPRSAIALLFAGLRERMHAHGDPLTVMSCDNLPGNGDITRRVLLQYADATDPGVAAWIRTNCTFPNSMVDRITPAPDAGTVALAAESFGVEDPAAVASESFLQWIIEDDFAGGRPRLETVGVQFVEDVAPYEKMKVRLLNGSHSAIAYLSYLMGYREVDAAMTDALIAEFAARYMDDDITPSIPKVPGVDLASYKATLRQRFANPAISDKVQRLAMDGSQKIPNAIVPPLEFQLEHNGTFRFIAFAIAAWYRYLQGVDEHGAPIEITDPLGRELQELAQSSPNDATTFLARADIFGARIPGDLKVISAVNDALVQIQELGTHDALTKLLR